jgi:hypothetical protein
MQTFGDFEVRDDFRISWIFDINNRRAMGWIHMADICVAIFDDNGAAAREIHAAELFDVFAYADWGTAIGCHSSS